jgi:hypothetical protein
MATKSQKDFSWVIWLIGAIILIALLLPLIVKVGGSYYRWGFSRKEEILAVSDCPECPECPAPTIIYEEVPTDEKVSDTCLFDAGKLGLLKDVANHVCNGKWGAVSPQLPSGTYVPFGTFTMDAEHRVWVLFDFTVPNVANYSFDYTDAERNLLQAPFLIGSELGWQGEERVPFTVCYDFEGECSLPENIIAEVFPTQ